MYNLFISHSWNYENHYNNLVDLLDKKEGFEYKNYSVPKDDPIHNAKSTKDLKEAIKAQMRPASCILILAGVYASYSKWINIEIELAKELNKKIIAIEPFGSKRTSQVVKDNADSIVRWNTNSIVDAIESPDN
ncbi:MAG: TIR domain-containing protein [Treponema sp.]